MKKRSALIQDIWMEIRRSRGRFLSILCIVMLGAGFFAGIKSTCPDMKQTAQQYFEDQSLMDMHLKSTMGFTEGDIQSLRNQPEAEIVEPGHSVDAFVALEGPDSLLARAWSWKLGAEQEEDALNLPVLQKGRWPHRRYNQPVFGGRRYRRSPKNPGIHGGGGGPIPFVYQF